MAYEILSELIGKRDVLSMSASEAKKVIADFYMAVEIATVGFTNEQAIDFFCKGALEQYGLDILAGA